MSDILKRAEEFLLGTNRSSGFLVHAADLVMFFEEENRRRIKECADAFGDNLPNKKSSEGEFIKSVLSNGDIKYPIRLYQIEPEPRPKLWMDWMGTIGECRGEYYVPPMIGGLTPRDAFFSLGQADVVLFTDDNELLVNVEFLRRESPECGNILDVMVGCINDGKFAVSDKKAVDSSVHFQE